MSFSKGSGLVVNDYLLKYHHFYFERINQLKERVRELHERLDQQDFAQHPTVKLAARIRQADMEIIPENPDRPEYRLKGEIKKYRRYKQGLQRYRLFFCFSNHPKIILYLYLNDVENLRKSGDKNDPYEEFKRFVLKGYFSHDPSDIKIEKWIHTYRP
jgi:mRNA-degrading endonuclease RelE of RelBE toxin-antitoxin system